MSDPKPIHRFDFVDRAQHLQERAMVAAMDRDFELSAQLFAEAAITLEKSQDWRQISSIWEGVAKLLEKVDSTPEEIPSVDERWPLDYHTMESSEWNKQVDRDHQIAWAYQWAAEQRVRSNPASKVGYRLHFWSARKAETCQRGIDDPIWPFNMYLRSLCGFARAHGAIDEPPEFKEIKQALTNMERCAERIDPQKRDALLALAYRDIRIILREAGNMSEARFFALKESRALSRDYRRRRKHAAALIQDLTGHDFPFFVGAVVCLVLVIFPILYARLELVQTDLSIPNFGAAILLSLKTAFIMGEDTVRPVGAWGQILTVLQTVISFFGLGIVVGRVAKRTEFE